MAKRTKADTGEDDKEPEISFPRLMYRGPEDSTAETKRVEDGTAYEQALDEGWRLQRIDPDKIPKTGSLRERTSADSTFNPHNQNTEEVLRHVASVYDAEELDRLKELEQEHPQFEGGRSAILGAIAERQSDLDSGSGKENGRKSRDKKKDKDKD